MVKNSDHSDTSLQYCLMRAVHCRMDVFILLACLSKMGSYLSMDSKSHPIRLQIGVGRKEGFGTTERDGTAGEAGIKESAFC